MLLSETVLRGVNSIPSPTQFLLGKENSPCEILTKVIKQL